MNSIHQRGRKERGDVFFVPHSFEWATRGEVNAFAVDPVTGNFQTS